MTKEVIRGPRTTEFIPPAFEPDQPPPEREAVVFQGTIIKEPFRRTLKKLRLPHRRGGKVRSVPARVEVGVALDQRDGTIKLRPYDTHKHPTQADFPRVGATVFESQHRLEASDAQHTSRPPFRVRIKKRAARVHVVKVDEETVKRGGDPKARVRKRGGFFTTWRPQ